MIFTILFGVVVAYAAILSIWVVRRTVGTFHISFKADGEVKNRLDVSEDFDELAKHKTAIFMIKVERE